MRWEHLTGSKQKHLLHSIADFIGVSTYKIVAFIAFDDFILRIQTAVK